MHCRDLLRENRALQFKLGKKTFITVVNSYYCDSMNSINLFIQDTDDAIKIDNLRSLLLDLASLPPLLTKPVNTAA